MEKSLNKKVIFFTIGITILVGILITEINYLFFSSNLPTPEEQRDTQVRLNRMNELQLITFSATSALLNLRYNGTVTAIQNEGVYPPGEGKHYQKAFTLRVANQGTVVIYIYDDVANIVNTVSRNTNGTEKSSNYNSITVGERIQIDQALDMKNQFPTEVKSMRITRFL